MLLGADNKDKKHTTVKEEEAWIWISGEEEDKHDVSSINVNL